MHWLIILSRKFGSENLSDYVPGFIRSIITSDFFLFHIWPPASRVLLLSQRGLHIMMVSVPCRSSHLSMLGLTFTFRPFTVVKSSMSFPFSS